MTVTPPHRQSTPHAVHATKHTNPTPLPPLRAQPRRPGDLEEVAAAPGLHRPVLMNAPFLIPTGLHPSAQACAPGATLGHLPQRSPQPQRGFPIPTGLHPSAAVCLPSEVLLTKEGQATLGHPARLANLVGSRPRPRSRACSMPSARSWPRPRPSRPNPKSASTSKKTPSPAVPNEE
jgi:hypothetical protein